MVRAGFVPLLVHMLECTTQPGVAVHAAFIRRAASTILARLANRSVPASCDQRECLNAALRGVWRLIIDVQCCSRPLHSGVQVLILANAARPRKPGPLAHPTAAYRSRAHSAPTSALSSHSQCSNAPARRCDTRKAAVVDAGAVAPLLRTFAMGIPELAGELAAVSGETDLAAPVPDEQRHLHGCALWSLCHPRRHVTLPQEIVALWQPQP